MAVIWIWIRTEYDTVDLRALRSWRDATLNLAHGTETKRIFPPLVYLFETCEIAWFLEKNIVLKYITFSRCILWSALTFILTLWAISSLSYEFVVADVDDDAEVDGNGKTYIQSTYANGA